MKKSEVSTLLLATPERGKKTVQNNSIFLKKTVSHMTLVLFSWNFFTTIQISLHNPFLGWIPIELFT